MDSESDLANIIHLNYARQYSQLIAFALLYYDYFLTLHDEVLLFWGPNFRKRMGVLFLVNRYIQLFGNITIILEEFGRPSSKGCRGLLVFHQCFVVATQTIVGFVLIMRVYAVFARRAGILLFLVAVVGSLFGIAVWAVFAPSQSTMTLPNLSTISECPSLISADQSQRMAIVWEGLLFGDTVVFCLTAYRMYQLRQTVTNDLTNLLLRDAFVYYIAMCIANSLNIATFLSSEPVIRGAGSTFANVVSSTCISRLMLNIRSRAHREPSTPRRQTWGEELTADLYITTFDNGNPSHHVLTGSRFENVDTHAHGVGGTDE